MKQKNHKAVLAFLLVLLLLLPAEAGAAYNPKTTLGRISGGAVLRSKYLPKRKTLTSKQKKNIKNALKKFTSQGKKISFVLLDIRSGGCICYDADRYYFSASTIKGPYVVNVMKNYVDKGKASLKKTKFRRGNYAYNGGTGTIKNDPSSKVYTLKQVITTTIKNSDNIGYNMLYSRFGGSGMQKWLKSQGVSKYSGYEQYGNICARDLARMWLGVYKYFNSRSKNAAWTKSCFAKSSGSVIQSQLGKKKKVYSKPGFMSTDSFHDAGIIDDGKHPYILVVLSNVSGWNVATQAQNGAIVGRNKENLKNLIKRLDKVHDAIWG